MKNWKVIAFVMSVFALTLYAQTNTIPLPDDGTIPTGPNGLLLTIIPLLVPILVAVFKTLLKAVPTWVLPILAPALGALLDYIGSIATGGAASPVMAALLGSAGVGIRELIDQVRGRLADGPKQP